MNDCSANLESGQARKQFISVCERSWAWVLKCMYTLLFWDAVQLPAGMRFLKRQKLHSELWWFFRVRDLSSLSLGFGADSAIAGLICLAFKQQLHTPFVESIRAGFGPTAHPQHLRAPDEMTSCNWKHMAMIPWQPQWMEQHGVMCPKCVGQMQQPRSGDCFVLSLPDICTACDSQQLLRHHISPSSNWSISWWPVRGFLLQAVFCRRKVSDEDWTISPTFHLNVRSVVPRLVSPTRVNF